MKIKKLLLILAIIIILINITTLNTQSSVEKDSTIVLVTGYGPFLSHSVNPSELIAKEIDGEKICGAKIIGLPVHVNLSNFEESIDFVYKAIIDFDPNYVFSIGLAAPYNNIRIEKIGYNFKVENKEDASLEILIKKGRFMRISALPAIKIVRELKKQGISSQMSFRPGLSLCNGLLYSVIHYVCVNNLDIKSGFIHVPLHKSQENPDGMELETMVNATRIIIETTLDFYSRGRLI